MSCLKISIASFLFLFLEVPYVLRMFFWKDMLARKKREDNNIDELQKYKNKATKQKVILGFNKGLPIIRDRRSQADEWPTNHKTDAQKRGYRKKIILTRKKRILPIEEEENEEESTFKRDEIDDDFASLFVKPSPRIIRSNDHIVKKELVSDILLKDIVNVKKPIHEIELLRNKRNSSSNNIMEKYA